MYYDHKTSSGKNSSVMYYIANYCRLLTPRCFFRSRLQRTLQRAQQREDYGYILDRAAYYNKLNGVTPLPADAERVADFRRKGKRSAYFFDTFEYLRWFPRGERFKYVFGDVTTVPPWPAIVKSRPIAGDNANSVVLNLVKVRHFTFLDDRKPFREKRDQAVFRGDIGQKVNRLEFMRRFFGHPAVDAGVISPSPDFPVEWSEGKRITLWQHLDFKYILALEGNDVASNLKWIMSSNSVAVMPRPTYETWFMEGRLEPDVHYIEIRPDFSDLEERLAHYTAHPEQAERIIENAHRYIAQFLNPEREKIISLMVLDKYFRCTE